MKIRNLVAVGALCLPLTSCYVGPDPYYNGRGDYYEHGYGRSYRHGYDYSGGPGYYHGYQGRGSGPHGWR